MASDRRRYREVLRGRRVVMGSGTYSISGPENTLAAHVYVLTNHQIGLGPKADAVHDLAAILALAGTDDELVVAGGGQVFAQLLPHADKLYLTYIDVEIEGSVYFPDFDESAWRKVENKAFKKDKDNAYDYRFVTLIRK